ncbi:MAG: hypothetical protein ABL901_14255 [Hyphomicrobiaceae bacterium]
MFGGLLKSTSLAALVAVAGVAVSGVSAQAADLGGNCCADLEERIAELEATTARKGNRKVSLTVSGWVNEAVMFFDDGVESNAYQVTNMVAQSRVRFVGSAKIDQKLSAGYLMELGINGARSDDVSSPTDDSASATSAANAVGVRHSTWWINHADLGKVWVGQTSQATDAITEVTTANTGHFVAGHATQFGAMQARNSATGAVGSRLNLFFGGTGLTSTAGTDSAQIGEGNRRNLVKYDTPTLAGFVASASVGEDKFWDVALRYAGEFSGFKLAAGIGYEVTTDGNVTPTGTGERNCINNVVGGSDVQCQQLGISGSIMHVPTGLFVTGVYGQRSDDKATNNKESTHWRAVAGIEQKFTSLGKTTLFGEYAQFDIGNTAALGIGSAAAESTVWGLGLNQAIDAAAMDLYFKYNNVGDLSTTSVAGVKTRFEDVQVIMTGARIQF